jgi:hypothetical protein
MEADPTGMLHHNTYTSSFLLHSWGRVAYSHLPQQLFKDLRSMPIAFGRRFIEREVPLAGKILNGTSMDLSFVDKI